MFILIITYTGASLLYHMHLISYAQFLFLFQRFLNADVLRLKHALSAEELDRLRKSGTDVRKHIIDIRE